MKSAVKSIYLSKSKSWTLKQYYLLFIHFTAIFFVLQGGHRLRSRTGAFYPILTSSREHFLSAVRPYTALREVDTELAGPNYLEAPRLRESDVAVLRVLVENYIHFHKRNRHNASRILIFRPRRTGLGDRLSVLAFTFWAASVSERLFLVDWQYPFPLRQLFQNTNPDVDMFFNQRLDDPNRETTSGNSSSKVAYLQAGEKGLKEYESILFSNVRTVIVEMLYTPKLSKAFIAKRFPAEVLPSYVNSVPSTVSFFRIVFHNILKLSDEMLQYQKQMSKKMKIRPTYLTHPRTSWLRRIKKRSHRLVEKFDENARPYIAVHARVGSGVGEFKEIGRFKNIGRDMKTGAMCLAARAVRLAHMSGHPPLPIYLATDTPSFRDVFREVVGNFSHGRVEVVGGDWNVVHINAFTLPNNTRGAQTPKQQKALRDVYADFVMLGHAEHIVALYSSFPRLAQGVGTARTLTELRNDVCFKIDKWKRT
ncbi:hypothetical protein FGB62_25g029 [Gracilaria domingensis]|nr:hypothetical protein FGB62_25g029 [Gracilaria domingensis]